MKTPAWLKKSWKDDTFRFMTYCILIGAVVFQIAMYATDYFDGGRVNWFPLSIILGWGFYLFIVLPVTYLNRNTR